MKKFFFLFLYIIPSFCFGASFDCTKAATPTEKAICSDKQVSMLDSFMSIDFKNKIKNSNDKNAVIQDQRHWNKYQRDKCGSDVRCLVKAYEERLDGSLDIESINKYLVNDGWKKIKYLEGGKRFCTHEYSKGVEKIFLGVYCAGDAFNTLTFK